MPESEIWVNSSHYMIEHKANETKNWKLEFLCSSQMTYLWFDFTVLSDFLRPADPPMFKCNWKKKLVFFLFFFLGPHPKHMESPRLGVKSKLLLPAYTTAIATWDSSHICNPHHSSRQCCILNPLSEARDWTRVLMDTSRFINHWAITGSPASENFKN